MSSEKKNTRSIVSRRRFMHMAGGAALWSGCVSLPRGSRKDLIQCHFIDVGYGDAILVKKDQSSVFIDGGYPPMTKVVLNHFKRFGITHLDAIVLTHPHPDHIGGAYGVLNAGIHVSQICSSYPLSDSAIPNGFRHLVSQRIDEGSLLFQTLRDGERVGPPGGIEFDVIHPEELVPDMNDSSLVIHCAGFENGILLTGDIGPAAQERIIARHKDRFPVSLLKAPHHGGHSLEEFYRLSSPELTIVSDGINPYGNPCDKTLLAARRWSKHVIRLSVSGTVIVQETPVGRLEWFFV